MWFCSNFPCPLLQNWRAFIINISCLTWLCWRFPVTTGKGWSFVLVLGFFVVKMKIFCFKRAIPYKQWNLLSLVTLLCVLTSFCICHLTYSTILPAHPPQPPGSVRKMLAEGLIAVFSSWILTLFCQWAAWSNQIIHFYLNASFHDIYYVPSGPWSVVEMPQLYSS